MSPNQSEKGNPLIKNRYKQGSLAKLPGKPSKGKRQLTDEERQARMGQRKFVSETLAKYDWDRSGGLGWDELKAFLRDLGSDKAEPTEVR
jgi:hypothetical protein